MVATRDSIYTRYSKFGFDFYLVDTAGIRKKNKVNEDIEYYSVTLFCERRSEHDGEVGEGCETFPDGFLEALYGFLGLVFLKIKYITMLKGSQVPTFIFFCNLPQWVKEPYRRYRLCIPKKHRRCFT